MTTIEGSDSTRGRGRRLHRVLVAAAVLQAAVSSAALGAPGDFDNSFSSDGRVTTEIGAGSDGAGGVAIQDDGKIVVAGTTNDETAGENNFAVVRYNSDGSLDDGFGDAGKVTTDIDADDEGNAVALQDDGKVVVAGYSDDGDGRIRFAVVRYNSDGIPDPTFDDDGIVTTDVDGAGLNDTGYARAVAIQDDGKIVVVGESFTDSTYELTVVRYEPDGDPDPTFDDDGIATALLGTGDNSGNAVAIQDDGKIVVAGRANEGSLASQFAVARFTSEGGLDPGFGAGGEVTTPVGTNGGIGYAVTVQDDGKIVMAGYSDEGTHDFTLVRYDPGGGLDSGFGTNGKVITDTDGDAHAVAIQDDGRIVAAGDSFNGTDTDFATVRYDPDGTVDAGFGTGGKVITDLGHDRGSGLVVHDGRIVVAGSSESDPSSGSDFAAIRYLGRATRSTTVVSSATTRVFGQRFTLSGTVSSADPSCVDGVSVRIERDVLGGGVSFAPLTTVETDVDGDFSLTRTADRGATYRATVASNDSCATVAATKTVTVKKKVTLSGPRKVAKGTVAKLKATVAPCSGHQRDKVTLQRRTPSGFKKVATKATSAKCVAIFKVVMTKTRVFRVVAPKTDADHLAGTSALKRVRAV